VQNHKRISNTENSPANTINIKMNVKQDKKMVFGKENELECYPVH
jgi:hypothetical protein